MSSRIILQPDQFELKPLKAQPPHCATPHLFSLRFLFNANGQWQYRFPIHVEPALAAEFQAGTVVEAHVEALDHNGVAQQSLAGSPQYAVLGIVLASGRALSGVPVAFVTAKRWRLAWTLGLILAGLLLAAPEPLVAGVLVGLASFPLRTALAIPTKPTHSARARATNRSFIK